MNEDEVAPTLEDYGLSASAYTDYRKDRDELQKLKDSYEGSSAMLYFLASGFFFVVSLLFQIDWLASVALALFLGLFALGAKDWFSNLVSGGKYKQATERLTVFEKQFLDKVRPFEQASRKYYEVRLRDFYETNLFRKRSDNPRFQEALEEFSSMLDELDQVNHVFKTTRFNLRKYEEYVIGRNLKRLVSQKPEKVNFGSLSQLSPKRESAKQPVVVPAPEKTYEHARIIDWDEVNKVRRMTGLKGEEIVLHLEKDYLVSVGRKDLSLKVNHVSKERGDGLGYDILSFTANGNEKYIEVKTSTSISETPFYLSSNELKFLKDHFERAYIYRVANINEAGKITLKVYSANDVLNSSNIVPTQFLVRMD